MTTGAHHHGFLMINAGKLLLKLLIVIKLKSVKEPAKSTEGHSS